MSTAGAGLVGCSTDQVEKLMPYVTAPEEITPGVATWYSTVCGECSAGCGAWVKTREGRAIKLEGNPNHPISGGALCARGQSALQGLYDPDRLSGPMRRAGETFEAISWDEAQTLLVQGVQGAGSNLVLVSGATGPTLTDLQERLVGAIGGRRIEYEAASEAPLREAARIVFGSDSVPSFDFESAGIVLSFGADFLGSWVSPVEHARGFARASGTDEAFQKSRFVFVGPRLSLTGQNADEWVPIEPGMEGLVALGVANLIASSGAGEAGPYAELLSAYDPQTVSAQAGVPVTTLEELAARFMDEGPGLAVGPGVAGQGRTATAANLAVLVLNAVGGAVGRTIHPAAGHLSAASAPAGDLTGIVPAMSNGQIQALIIHNTNPAYSLPPASGFTEALGSVPFTVAITDRMDETASRADLVLPDRHFLESWGDSNPRPGLWAIQQPAMQPVPHFDSRGSGDVLLALAGALGQDFGAETFYDYLRAAWLERHATEGSAEPFESFWRGALRVGIVDTPEVEQGPTILQAPDRALSVDAAALDGEGLALLVYPSTRFGDGRLANRTWLQELPDPVSKVSWHSWIEIHPDTATDLGVSTGDIVRVTSPHGEVEVPVWTYPGIVRSAAALAMGGGHTSYGRVADGRGVNPMTLLPTEIEQPSGSLVHLATRVQLEPTGERRRMASIEGSSDQHDRPIAPAVQLAALAEGELGAEEHEEIHELQAVGGFVPTPTEAQPQDFPLEGARYGPYDPETTARWAMAVDLDKCTGCSACVTACQSENNVATVGEAQMMMGRDLQWIRLERFYEELNADEPGPVDVRFLPMLCQHCGNAPCEPVCPVYAAYHTPEGLNAQVYNRCVGTRYCANNCPYKVRVFNWFDFSDVPEPLNWQYNPDVTVRSGGVMEKCSFCVQRIRQAENRATLEGRTVRDGDVVPACQQSCPAEAIVFGNIRDPESRVAQVSEGERTYRVLDVLINTQPAVNYLRKVTFHPVEEIHV